LENCPRPWPRPLSFVLGLVLGLEGLSSASASASASRICPRLTSLSAKCFVFTQCRPGYAYNDCAFALLCLHLKHVRNCLLLGLLLCYKAFVHRLMRYFTSFCLASHYHAGIRAISCRTFRQYNTLSSGYCKHRNL